MFGTYRTLLALVVVYVHFVDSTALPGHYAVFGFFTLSGYLMTLIMNRNYGYGVKGIALYGVNRALRIYPMYWLTCVIAVAILMLIGSDFSGPYSEFSMPQTWRQWLTNILLYVKITTRPTLVQPAWTLTVELFYYLCIGLGLSRNRRITAVWLILAVLYTGYMVAVGASFTHRFFSIGAAALPFALGASLYHWRDELSRWLAFFSSHVAAPATAFGLFLANGAAAHLLGGYEGLFFYTNVPICALLVITLCQRKHLAGISRGFDKLMGDLSYPIYLVHAPLGWLLLYFCKLADVPVTGPSLLTFFLFLGPTVLASWLMSILIERPIENIRSRFKSML